MPDRTDPSGRVYTVIDDPGEGKNWWQMKVFTKHLQSFVATVLQILNRDLPALINVSICLRLLMLYIFASPCSHRPPSFSFIQDLQRASWEKSELLHREEDLVGQVSRERELCKKAQGRLGEASAVAADLRLRCTNLGESLSLALKRLDVSKAALVEGQEKLARSKTERAQALEAAKIKEEEAAKISSDLATLLGRVSELDSASSVLTEERDAARTALLAKEENARQLQEALAAAASEAERWKKAAEGLDPWTT